MTASEGALLKMQVNARTILVLILLIAFLLRLGAALTWQRAAEAEGRLFRLGDSHSYWTLAEHLGHGRPYEYGSSEARIFRAPLYPLLLAPLTRISNENAAVGWARVLGCFLGTVAVGLVALLALRLGGIHAALATAALAAIYPSAIGMSIIVLSEALFMPLMVGYLLLWQRAWVAVSPKQFWGMSFLAGCLAGAAVLTRPSWLLFLPFVCGLGLVLGPWRTRHARIFLGTLLGLSLVMAPWWIRNASITGHFVPTTLQVGPSLYDGLHAGATGASDEGMAFMKSIIADQQREDARASEPPKSTLEYRINARAQGMALAWAQAHPGEVLRLSGRKFLRIWSLWPDGGDAGSPAIRWAVTLSCFAVLLLAIRFNWALRPRFSWIYSFCWLPCIYFTLLHMVFVGSVRYREPGMFVVLALAGCALSQWMKRTHASLQPETNVAREHGSGSVSQE